MGPIGHALAVGVFTCAKDGTLTEFNRRCVGFWGVEPAVGHAKFSGAYKTYGADGQLVPEAEDPTAIVLRSGEPIESTDLTFERPDGERIAVKISVDPIFAEDGELVGAVGCIQDVRQRKDVEARLEAERRTLDSIIETTPECIKTVAPDGTLLQMNAAGLQMIEAEAPIAGVSVFSIIAPEFLDVWKSNHRRVCAGEKLTWEFDLIGLSGTRRHLETHAVPIRLPDGRQGQLAITRDVTHKKTVEARMVEREHRFRQVLESLPIALYTTDDKGKITFFNKAAVELSGRTPTLGSDTWCVTWRIYGLDGERIPHEACPMAVALREKRHFVGPEVIAERPDGSRVHFVPYPSPIFDSKGQLVGAVNILIDVTKRLESELQAARLAAIVASSDDAIVSKTLDGYITTWNAGAERIFGYSAEEMIGQHITRIIPPELKFEEDDILARLRRGEHVDHFETVRLAKSGRRIDVSVTVSPMRDKSGKPIGASKVGRDITERKHFERSQELLIGELNHRVKNTLAMVQSIANQTVHRAKSPNEFAASFGGRLQALARTHTILTQSTWHGADLLAMLREQLPIGPDDGRVSYSGPSVMLNAQTALHLGLVLHELATNAMKYGALSVPKGRLSVRWTVRTEGERFLSLRWEERGGPKVSVPKSHGFGSTLIEKSLEAHGGVTSIGYEGEGMTCDIKLPLSDNGDSGGGSYNRLRLASRETLNTGRSTGEPVMPNIAGRRVLVVDDEPLIAMDIVASLEEEGCKIVGPAATQQKALNLIESAEIDAALLDANLAGDPVDVLAAALMRRKIPFAFVSGYGREGLPEAFRQATLIKKPFQRQSLIEAVQKMVLKTDTIVPLRRTP